MRVLVLYDTVHGNTEQVANAIADGLGAEVDVKRMANAGPDDLLAAELVVAGCPTHAWNVSASAKAFLARLKGMSFAGKPAATFDTKFRGRFTGSAARKLAGALAKAGFHTVADPESFFVAGMQGPLREGELDRAREFGERLSSHSGSA